MAALNHLFRIDGHVVAQVVKPELAVGAVCDVGLIGCPALALIHERIDDRHLEAHGLIQRAHPVCVAAGQIIVDRYHVDAFAFVSVENNRERSHKGLALAGFHFRDVSIIQRHGADELHVEGTHSEPALRLLARQREDFDKMLVQRRTCFNKILDFKGALQDVAVAHGLNAGLKRIDFGNLLAVALEGIFVGIQSERAFQ